MGRAVPGGVRATDPALRRVRDGALLPRRSAHTRVTRPEGVPVSFARDRLVRLGIPLAAFMFVLWPLMTYGLYLAAASVEPVGRVRGRPDPRQRSAVVRGGPADLLADLCGLGLVASASGHAPTSSRRPLRARSLVALGAGVPSSHSSSGCGSPRLAPVHECAPVAVAGVHRALRLGIVSAKRWLQPVPERIRGDAGGGARRDRGTVRGIRVDTGFRIGDRSVRGAGGAGRLSCSRRSEVRCRSPRRSGSSPSRSGIRAAPAEPSEHLAAPHSGVHVPGLPLIVAALSLRSFDIPLEVKALLVAAGGVAGSFALGWALVAHTRLGRIM